MGKFNSQGDNKEMRMFFFAENFNQTEVSKGFQKDSAVFWGITKLVAVMRKLWLVSTITQLKIF